MACFVCVLLASPALAQTDPLEQAITHHRAGEWPEALAGYRRVIAEGTDDARSAQALSNACDVLNQMSKPAQALEDCQQALDLRRKIGDEIGVARTLVNRGRALSSLGRYDEAKKAYEESLAKHEQLGDMPRQVRNRLNLGELARKTGRYGEAMRFTNSAESLAGQHAGEPWAPQQVLIAGLNRGAVLENLGAYREALELYHDLAAEEDFSYRAQVQVNLGVIYRNLGDPVRALESFERAAEEYEELGDTAGLSNARLNVALALHLNLRRLDEAEDVYLEALELARRSADRSEEIQDLFYLGDLQLELGRLGDAERSFESCLELAEDSGSAEGHWSGLYGLGRIAEARGDLSTALEHFRQSMAEIEQVHSSLTDATAQSGYFGDKRPIYAAAVRVLARLHSQEPAGGNGDEALAIVQRAKARGLIESLRTAAAEPLSAEALRRLPRAGEVLLEYFRGKHNLYLWILRDNGIRLVDLGPAQPILDRIVDVHEALAASRVPPPETVAQLSRDLLGDGSAFDGATRLRVAPDSQLCYLPFEILTDPGSPAGLLLDRMVVSYLPSASTLALLDQRRADDEAGPSDMLVGFANPELSAEPGTPAGLIVSRYGLEALPAAERELETVGRILAGEQELQVGSAATEHAFRRTAARNRRVMHLATHAVVDERPGQSAMIVLAAGEDHDGLLYPQEIAALDVGVRLTVLASCRSALGEAEGGRALTSLTGAFLAAGSSGVVATLWEIDDSVTTVFMEQFYHQLSRGRGAAEGLRRAKMRLRSEARWDHPGIWSAYVLVGEAGSVIDRSLVPAWAWVPAALLLAAGLAVGLPRRR